MAETPDPPAQKISPLTVRVPDARVLWATAALVSFSFCTAVALLQPARHPARLAARSWAEWFFRPEERNPPLQTLDSDLNGVFALDEYNVWAVGSRGTLIHSDDGGRTWERQTIQSETPSPTPTSSPTPMPTPGMTTTGSTNTSTSGNINTNASGNLNLNRSGGSGSNTARPNDGNTARPNDNRPAPAPTLFDTIPSGPSPVPSQTPAPTADGVFRGDLVAVIFRDEQRGWVVARDGPAVFSTEDGGATWQRGAGSKVSSFSRTEYFIVGDGVVYTLTDDGVVDTHGAVFSPALWGAVNDADYNNFRITGQGVRVGAGGRIHTGNSDDYKDRASGTTADLRAVYALSESSGLVWAVGDGGTILRSDDGGSVWGARQRSETAARLNGVYFLNDASHGWAVGDDGIVLGTADGGANWVRLMRGKDEYQAGKYSRSWPPWYFVGLIGSALLLVPAVRRRKEDAPAPEVSVADVLVSDRPLERGDLDHLQFEQVALGLSRFLRNENTLPPLTIAVTGEWGTGKSSLMNLLRADLRSYGFRPVWFNAWHHQKEEHLLASLLQNVRLQAIPRWSSAAGIQFRARLLLIRGWRRSLPVLALLFVSAALVAYAVTRIDAGEAAPGDQVQRLVTFVKSGFVAPSEAADRSKTAPALALLLGVGSIAVAAWKGVTAFGVKPASLLATVSNSMRLRDLEAQTSFRKKFADEFTDVTRALGARSMIVFIDDLDRCRPENVLETLEAVNFLVSSGGCFVVLGMARERVERVVGLSFKDVAEEVMARADDDADEAQTTPKAAAAAQDAPDDDDSPRDRRTKFARQYLDKLINIEVPVPKPTPEQSCQLLVGAGEAAAPAPAFARHWQRAKSIASAAAPVAAALAVVAAGVYAGYRLHQMPVPEQRAQGTPPAGAASSAGNPAQGDNRAPSVSSDPAGDANRAAGTGSGVNTNTGANTNPANMNAANANAANASVAAVRANQDERAARSRAQTGVLAGTTASPRSLLSWWPLLLALALASWVAHRLLTRRPDLVVKDSDDFKEALRIWHPLLFTELQTPRSLKRFMNRVRYLAMRQRPPAESRTLWERLRSEFDRRTGRAPGDAREEATAIARIPEQLLVAFATFQQLNPGWTEAEYYFQHLAFDNPEGATRLPARDWPLVVQAKRDHERRFGRLSEDELGRHLKTFLKMSADIRVN